MRADLFRLALLLGLLAMRVTALGAAPAASESPPALLRQINKIAGHVRHSVPFVSQSNGEHGTSMFEHVQHIVYDARSASLIIDDAQTFWTETPSNQAPPHTDRKRYVVPLGEAEVIRNGVHTYQGGVAEEVKAPIIAVACRDGAQCATVRYEAGPAAKASAGVIECASNECAALGDAIERLIVLVRPRVPLGAL